ncbi:hypothetical protein NDU88_002317 [Pleurodeles waltl]|uniref:Uncharacterized protein n=1 Tax=Pleurodeles waltl TaxID=8319 RepID=A0AAV7QBC6_PLEWA|nr:hypothetical protein NDU88_002317 [Pleurodeles waltl]
MGKRTRDERAIVTRSSVSIDSILERLIGIVENEIELAEHMLSLDSSMPMIDPSADDINAIKFGTLTSVNMVGGCLINPMASAIVETASGQDHLLPVQRSACPIVAKLKRVMGNPGVEKRKQPLRSPPYKKKLFSWIQPPMRRQSLPDSNSGPLKRVCGFSDG